MYISLMLLPSLSFAPKGIKASTFSMDEYQASRADRCSSIQGRSQSTLVDHQLALLVALHITGCILHVACIYVGPPRSAVKSLCREDIAYLPRFTFNMELFNMREPTIDFFTIHA